MTVSRTIKLLGAAFALLTLVGCAIPSSGIMRPEGLAVVHRDSVPKEKWSDALVMATDQMGLNRMMDAAPGSLYGSSYGLVHEASARRTTSGTDVFLLTGSLGLGALSSLTTDGSDPKMQVTQIAYWVPADQVSSPQEAITWVEEQWYNNQVAFYNGANSRPLRRDPTSRYPIHHGSMYESLTDMVKEVNRAQYEAPASVQTVGDVTGEFYGPIFVDYGDALFFNKPSSETYSDFLQRFAPYLSDTAMVYSPGHNIPKGYTEAFILHKGKKYTFVAKGL